MAFSKAHRFKPADYHFSLLCRALSHPARIVMLRNLIQHEDQRLPVSDLRKGIPLIHSSVSRHIKILRDMGIVRCDGHGPDVSYSLNPGLPNTYLGIITLVLQVEELYQDRFAGELTKVGARQTIGGVPA